ncbi:MAG: putative endonuclease [Pseudohongiellaceae bacterium]|jgi:putative endonuclease
MPPDLWHIYLVRSADGKLYTGISTDVQRRFAEHGSDTKRGARALRGKGPLQLVYQDKVGERGLAQRLEYRLKRLPKAQKEHIVSSRTPAAQLARRLVDDESSH